MGIRFFFDYIIPVLVLPKMAVMLDWAIRQKKRLSGATVMALKNRRFQVQAGLAA